MTWRVLESLLESVFENVLSTIASSLRLTATVIYLLFGFNENCRARVLGGVWHTQWCWRRHLGMRFIKAFRGCSWPPSAEKNFAFDWCTLPCSLIPLLPVPFCSTLRAYLDHHFPDSHSSRTLELQLHEQLASFQIYLQPNTFQYFRIASAFDRLAVCVC